MLGKVRVNSEWKKQCPWGPAAAARNGSTLFISSSSQWYLAKRWTSRFIAMVLTFCLRVWEILANKILDTNSKPPRLLGAGERTYEVVVFKYIHKFFDTPPFKWWSRSHECGLDLLLINRIWQKWQHVTCETRLEKALGVLLVLSLDSLALVLWRHSTSPKERPTCWETEGSSQQPASARQQHKWVILQPQLSRWQPPWPTS